MHINNDYIKKTVQKQVTKTMTSGWWVITNKWRIIICMKTGISMFLIQNWGCLCRLSSLTCCIWHVWCTVWTEHPHFDFVALPRELPSSTSSRVVSQSPVGSAALLWCSKLDYSTFRCITIPEIIKNKLYLLGKMLKFVFIFTDRRATIQVNEGTIIEVFPRSPITNHA